MPYGEERLIMLNLVPVFDDAVNALQQFPEFLKTWPLPATVFMMQRDVVNHYRHALVHYFDLTLNEEYLQNSSIGPPYTKWAKFTNEDFGLFSFAFHNLLRYTSRLIHETECEGLQAAYQFSESSRRSNSYTNPIGDCRDRKVGIRIEPDHVLVKTPFATLRQMDGQIIHSGKGKDQVIRHITTDATGTKHVAILTFAEYRELLRVLRESRHDISDRGVITALKAEGLAECDILADRNRAFADVVNRYYTGRNVASEFDAQNESWWV